MDCLHDFQSIHLKHYTVKPETLTSFMIDVFSQSSLDNILSVCGFSTVPSVSEV